MIQAIEVYAYGDPKGQPRARAFAFAGRARMYDPGTAEGWKAQVAQAIQPHLPEQPIGGALALCLDFVMPRPKGHYRSGKRSDELKDAAPHWHTGKPDCDNLAKAVMDALTTLSIWHDDCQVATLTVTKRYQRNKQERTGCAIRIEALQYAPKTA